MGINVLDSAIDSLQDWGRKEFVGFLGEDVGNAAADIVNGYVDIQYGVLNSGVDALHGLSQLDPTRFVYDPDGAAKTWGGALETAALAVPPLLAAEIATNPDGTLDKLKAVASYDDWNSDHPLRGLGHNIGDVAQAFIPGVGAAKPATTAAGIEGRIAAADARAAGGTLDAAAARAAGSDIAAQGSRIADDLNDVRLPETTPPGAGPGPSVAPETTRPPVDTAPPPAHSGESAPPAGADDPVPSTLQQTPALTPSLAEPPNAPDFGNTPTQLHESPTERGLDSTPVERSPAPAPEGRGSDVGPSHSGNGSGGYSARRRTNRREAHPPRVTQRAPLRGRFTPT